MRRIAVALGLAFALFVVPINVSAASIGTKCSALVTELNRYRSPNVRLRSILCDIAHSRALQLAKGYKGPKGDGHNIQYVVRRLSSAGVCFRNVGEAIAWTGWPPSAARFINMWRTLGATTHWPMLSSSRYDRAGGSWRASVVGSGTYAVVIVMDAC